MTMTQLHVKRLSAPAHHRARWLLSVLLIVALVLPPLAVLPAPAFAQSENPEAEALQPVPTPEPVPDWPRVSSLPPYTPSLDPMPEPASQPVATPVAAASAEAVQVVDGEAGKRGVVVGAAMVASTAPAAWSKWMCRQSPMSP
jgi:hypothetical protein